ncbi:hypothetical protein F511_44003 [Dorcoceras hygrometricum]|uniref:Uncharacterized protein n=1 Tax=Dorcoceras hygrometricum TaxID=472368 RepID=A0A2Z7AME4_9LAMI|nr:hypothetical protein F511_44003 [Dorcoceras hygrometricum]
MRFWRPKRRNLAKKRLSHGIAPCSLDHFVGGSTEPDLSSAHNQSKLIRSDTVADQIGSERDKTRRADYNRSDVKRR